MATLPIPQSICCLFSLFRNTLHFPFNLDLSMFNSAGVSINKTDAHYIVFSEYDQFIMV